MVLFEIGFIIVSILLILKGSEWITDSSVEMARKLQTSSVAIGLILVSVLLSLPELVIAISAILKGHAVLAFGVSLGSIVINLGLIIGLSAIIRPLKVTKQMVTRDAVFMVVITLAVIAIALEDFTVSRADGLVLLLLFIPYVVNVYTQEKDLTKRQKIEEKKNVTQTLTAVGKLDPTESKVKGHQFFILGAILLLVGGELFTRGLIGLAQVLNISDLLIGLTIGALGPSIPNLAASIQAARHGYEALAVSETIGSNIFTLLITLGIIAMIQPIQVDLLSALLTIPAVLVLSFMLLIFLLRGRLGKIEGIALLSIFLINLILQLLFHT